MSAEEPISKLMPTSGSHREDSQHRDRVRPIVNEIALHAVADRSSFDLLTEIYLAGLWHGAELMRQNAKIELSEAMK